MDHRVGNRVIIIGSSNAGKTTLATQLAERLSAPFVELDALHWEPGWVEADDEVFRERVRQAIATDTWVIEGNYISQQQHVSWPAADTIVWLDLSLPTVLLRCVRRTWRRWRTRELLYGNNREIFREHLMLWNTDKSLIAYTLRTFRSRRRTYKRFEHDPRWAHLAFFRLRSVAEVNRWLASVRVEPPASQETTDAVASLGSLTR